MKTTWRWQCLGTTGLGLALAALSGCQTWVPEAGLTLPSGHYLQHPPQYFPPSPPFPLTRELAQQQATAAAAPGALPPPVPVPPAAVPVPPAPAPQPGPVP
jgi:hypothetical protein